MMRPTIGTMLLPTLLPLVLPIVTQAKPLAEPSPDKAVAAQTQASQCDGGRSYCGWYDKASRTLPSCKCPGGQDWGEDSGRCRHPPLPKPSCGPTQKPICARSIEEWCDYDENNDLCRADGTTVVIVIEIDIDITVIQPTIEEECSKPQCPDGQTLWDDGECHYPCFDEDEVQKCKDRGGRPVCAETPDDFCDFDFRNRLCQDNGLTSFHCIEADSDSEKEELDYLVGTYASIDVSLEVLGSSCVLNGLGCVLNDDIWGLLCLVCDLGAVVCGLLDSLLGLC